MYIPACVRNLEFFPAFYVGIYMYLSAFTGRFIPTSIARLLSLSRPDINLPFFSTRSVNVILMYLLISGIVFMWAISETKILFPRKNLLVLGYFFFWTKYPNYISNFNVFLFRNSLFFDFQIYLFEKFLAQHVLMSWLLWQVMHLAMRTLFKAEWRVTLLMPSQSNKDGASLLSGSGRPHP